MIRTTVSGWTTVQWLKLVGVLVAIIVVLLLAWPHPAAAPDHITVRIVDGPTVLSTQVIPLNGH